MQPQLPVLHLPMLHGVCWIQQILHFPFHLSALKGAYMFPDIAEPPQRGPTAGGAAHAQGETVDQVAAVHTGYQPHPKAASTGFAMLSCRPSAKVQLPMQRRQAAPTLMSDSQQEWTVVFLCAS
jgi:hypothetical protein